MTDWSNLHEALQRQGEFSDLFFGGRELTSKEKEEATKTFVLSAHAELTGVADAVNYKDHRTEKHPVDVQKVLYKTVDVYRYVLATLNLWGITPTEFAVALSQKDDFLHYRHRTSQKKWNGEPVVLFDLDDVVAEFRESFCRWATVMTGHTFDPESDEYYNVKEFKKCGLSSEKYFKDFIDQHGFLLLDRNDKYHNLFRHLKESGYWVQVVTSRPASNLTAFYDTYSWLARNGLGADGVTFTPEKFVWLTDQEYFSGGRYFAVDDSAKHAAEYAKHGVKVIVPEKSYNREVVGRSNIVYVPREADPVDFVPKT